MESLNLIVLSTASWLSWGGVSMKDKKIASFLFFLVVWLVMSPLRVYLWYYWIFTLETLYILWFRWPFFNWSVQIVWPDPHSYYWSHNCDKNHQRSMKLSLYIKKKERKKGKLLLRFCDIDVNIVVLLFPGEIGYWRFCRRKCCILRVKNNSKGT